jgi:hypothetical protein
LSYHKQQNYKALLLLFQVGSFLDLPCSKPSEMYAIMRLPLFGTLLFLAGLAVVQSHPNVRRRDQDGGGFDFSHSVSSNPSSHDNPLLGSGAGGTNPIPNYSSPEQQATQQDPNFLSGATAPGYANTPAAAAEQTQETTPASATFPDDSDPASSNEAGDATQQGDSDPSVVQTSNPNDQGDTGEPAETQDATTNPDASAETDPNAMESGDSTPTETQDTTNPDGFVAGMPAETEPNGSAQDSEPTESNPNGTDQDAEPTEGNPYGSAQDQDPEPTEGNPYGSAQDQDAEPTEGNPNGSAQDQDQEPTESNPYGSAQDQDAEPTEGNPNGSAQDQDQEPTENNPYESAQDQDAEPTDINPGDDSSEQAALTPTPTPAPTTSVPTRAPYDAYSNYNNDGPTNSNYNDGPTNASPSNNWPTGENPGGNSYGNPTVEVKDPYDTHDTYDPPDDDPVKEDADGEIEDEWEEKTTIEIAEEDAEEMLHDKWVPVTAGICGGIAFFFMIFVAQQMIENPDGCCSKMCRCAVACFRILCCPCRKLCYCGGSRAKARRTHDLVMGDNGNYGYTHDLELT